MFPEINHITELLPFVQGNPQIRVQEQPNGTTIVCYMLQDEDTFSGENEAYAKECRGITFGFDGSVVSRTLHKFQNVGENDSTQPHLIPWDKITRIMDKRDGSMITPVLLGDGTIVCKTKKTFTSAEAIAATKFLHEDRARVDWCYKWLLNGYTPTFEWTSPRFPIVLLYEKDELTLLQIRENVTGEYMDLTKGPHFGVHDHELMPFPIVANLMDDENSPAVLKTDPKHLLEMAKVAEGIEGWIIQTNDGRMWKIKTKWYCDLHHAVTFTRWRDVARTVLDDGSDDLKGAFALTGRPIQPIIDVEKKIFGDLGKMIAEAAEHAAEGLKQNLTAKEMAAKHGSNELMRHIMRAFNGKPTEWSDWLDYYRKKHLDTWSLEVIPTVTENDNEPIA